MTDFFRVHRGVEIDAKVRIIPGSGLPGNTPDTDTASVGSIYMDTASGVLYTKTVAGSGFGQWDSASSSSTALYAENAISASPSTPIGANSLTLGQGAQTTANAHDSVAIGYQSLARLPGIVHASGRFASSGDAQVGQYLLRTVTVNSNFTEAFFDGTNGSERIVLPDDSTWTFTATITGHRQDANDGHAGYKVEGVICRGAGAASTSLVGSTIKSVIAESHPFWDVAIVADQTNGSIKLTVRGEAGKIIRWVAKIETIEVTN